MNQGKLYYQDCHLKSFTARVLSCQKVGEHYAVVLDQTAFYPEGGGQACDTGTLADVKVLEVREKEDKVIHTCDRPLEVGKTVTGEIDWQRRFDLMQQHTGEHLLSGVIYERYGYQNSGFHVGAQVMEVDFDGVIPPEVLPELEEQVNALVWQNIPVKCWYPSQEALPNVFYRTKRQLPWPVRIVEIPGGDSCACCGIHVANTGEVGLVKIISCVKLRGGVRIELVCGGRAYRYVRDIFEQNRRVSQLLSAQMPETAQAVEKLQQQYAQEKFRAAGLEKQVLESLAQSYRGQKDPVCFYPGLTGGSLRALAEQLAQLCSGTAAVFSGSDEGGYSMCLASIDTDVRPLGTALTKALNGRGGGKPNAFQGSLQAAEGQIRSILAEQWA